jgi:hypothetical protein
MNVFLFAGPACNCDIVVAVLQDVETGVPAVLLIIYDYRPDHFKIFVNIKFISVSQSIIRQ